MAGQFASDVEAQYGLQTSWDDEFLFAPQDADGPDWSSKTAETTHDKRNEEKEKATNVFQNRTWSTLPMPVRFRLHGWRVSADDDH